LDKRAITHLSEKANKGDLVAVQSLRKAGLEGNADAQYNIGRIYYYGTGVKEDYTESIKWFWMAAEQGNADAQYLLGESYATGRGAPKNPVEALRLFRLAAAVEKNSFYQYELAMMLSSGWEVPKDEYEALKWYRKAADNGNIWAMDWLVVDLCAENPEEAYYWAIQAKTGGSSCVQPIWFEQMEALLGSEKVNKCKRSAAASWREIQSKREAL